ncbi:unnamed protein product [Caenorhabditis sp. 36 PRJEB53466]|nr:unnamed protein product [Caenorhabditis sp. 36 PRJEB53466]
MFTNTLEALDVFQNAIDCVQCRKPSKHLQYLGTSCKHAHCWDCIGEMTRKTPGRRAAPRTLCPSCAFPLDTTKIQGAHVLNSCFETLTELRELITEVQRTPLTQAEISCTQRFLDDFRENSPGEQRRAIEKFLETQAHMPDELGQPEDESEEKRRENRESSISPELDLFNDYQEVSASKRTSVKRGSSALNTDDEPEQKPKKQSILKNPAKKTNPNQSFDIFASQIQTRKREDGNLTPFVNRRSTAPTPSSSGMVGMFAEPFRSNSSEKTAVKQEITSDDPFTKPIVLKKRMASMEAQAEKELKTEKTEVKIVRKEIPELEEPSEATTKRRSSVRFAEFQERSQSPMSSGDKSMSLRPEQRRSSYGTRRGEVVIINSILNNRIPQLKSAVEAGTCVNEKDNCGKTPLFVAVEHNSLEAVQILVEAGAVINACCGPTYETTLHEAIRRNNYQIVEYLLLKGASLKIRNIGGKTAEETARNDPKMRKIVDKFKSGHFLQPVIPPPKSKIHFVKLIDEKLLTDAEKKKLPGKINLVTPEMDTPTHVVVQVDRKTKVLNISKEHIGEVLKAIIKSGMIVSREWLKHCIIDAAGVDDDRHFMVKKVQWMDGRIFENTINEWKKASTRMQPKLFAGCKFYFPRPKYNFLDRATLVEIVRSAGGLAMTREPILNEHDPKPYHNPNAKTNVYIVYSLTHDIGDKFRNCERYNLVCEQWLIDAVLGCSITEGAY